MTCIANRMKSGVGSLLAAILLATPSFAQNEPTWTTDDWAAIGELPDWGGIWLPDIPYQREQFLQNDTPWTAEAGARIEDMLASKAAGNPYGLFLDCLPLGMPSWILGSHNALEFLYTPGRITMLGELDGNRMRRIYTDGRPHPEYPDLTYHGHSIGEWEGDTLVVDTVGILPEVYIAPDGENIGVRNGGGMHITERIYLSEADRLRVDLAIMAPNVLTETWHTTRYYDRLRGPYAEIIEGVCLQANYLDRLNEEGKTIFVPVPPDERQ